MKILELAKATTSLAEYAQSVNKEPVVLTVRGKPVGRLSLHQKCRFRDGDAQHQSTISRLD